MAQGAELRDHSGGSGQASGHRPVARPFGRELERHPSVEVIRRDRCGIYAEAAEQGAANAVQVADRFHLFLNLSTAIERALEERSRELYLPDQAPEQQAVEVPPPSERTITLEEQRKQQRRQRRHER